MGPPWPDGHSLQQATVPGRAGGLPCSRTWVPPRRPCPVPWFAFPGSVPWCHPARPVYLRSLHARTGPANGDNAVIGMQKSLKRAMSDARGARSDGRTQTSRPNVQSPFVARVAHRRPQRWGGETRGLVLGRRGLILEVSARPPPRSIPGALALQAIARALVGVHHGHPGIEVRHRRHAPQRQPQPNRR